jgi:hypothetical protein
LVFWVLPLLSVKSLVRLDSAMNGGFLSNDVVALMRQLYGSDRNLTRLGNLRKEAWLLSRGIYPVNIKLFCGVNNKEICSKQDITRCARTVSLNYCWMLSAPAIASFLTGCTSVTALDLGYCTGKTSVCFAIAHNCPQLASLSLHGAERISFSGLRLVMKRCTQMVELRLSYSSGLTFYNLLHIVSTLCQNLHTLHSAILLRCRVDGSVMDTSVGVKAGIPRAVTRQHALKRCALQSRFASSSHVITWQRTVR